MSPVKVPDSVTDTSTSFSSTFIAFDTEKVQETAVPESDFTFMDVHSPEPARKFIERSLHDLDDFISDRRLQLSEMKRINAKKISGEVPEHANPLYYSNYKKLQTPPIISSSEKPQSQFSSPSVSLPTCLPILPYESYHILSYPILPYHIMFHPIVSYPSLSNPILLYHILS